MLYTIYIQGDIDMIIDHNKFNTFKEYLDEMPFGILQYIIDHADLAKLTVIRASAGVNLQQDTLDKLMTVTGLPRRCFGTVNINRTVPTGRKQNRK